MAEKIKVATAWLDGCSGCHMSMLDMDERLIALAPHIELVYGPLVDAKAPPGAVDLAIIEGAVSNEDDLAKARKLRHCARFVIALGDCAVTGNVPSMRNPIGVERVFDRAYQKTVDLNPMRPTEGVPALLERAMPVHEAIDVDLFLPGCPPPADAIHFVLSELIAGRKPDPTQLTRFGA